RRSRGACRRTHFSHAAEIFVTLFRPLSLRLAQSHRPSIPAPTHSKGSAAQTSDTHNPSRLRIHELTISTTATPSRLEASISVKPRSNACAAGSPPPVATPYAI